MLSEGAEGQVEEKQAKYLENHADSFFLFSFASLR